MIAHRWFVPAVVFVVCWTLTTHGKFSVTGDEPHYLSVTQSLWADHDLDVRNNYDTAQTQRFGVDNLEPLQHIREAPDGRLLPVHDIGLSVALLPIYAAATSISDVSSPAVLQRFRMSRGLFAYSLISLFMIVLTTIAAVITRAALIADDTAPTRASVVTLAIWLSPPVLSHSFLIFPEPVALLVTAFVLRVAIAARERLRPLPFVAVTLALGMLPWCHRKYAPYALILFVILLWRHRAAVIKWPIGLQVGCAAAFVIPQVALLWWTWSSWGDIGGPLMFDRLPLSWSVLRVGAVGLLVDRENGLFVWAPLLLALPAAWAVRFPRDAIWLIPASTLFAVSAAHDQWWAGFSPAGRFLVPLAPIFALVLARALDHVLLRRVFYLLLIPQAVVTAWGWQQPRALWPRGDGQNRVLAGVLGSWDGVQAALPSLRAAEPEMWQALIMLAVIIVANAAIWMALRHTRHGRRGAPG